MVDYTGRLWQKGSFFQAGGICKGRDRRKGQGKRHLGYNKNLAKYLNALTAYLSKHLKGSVK